MNAKSFVDKWSKVDLKETSFYQSHFIDICDLVGHPQPIEVDPTGVAGFSFEKKTRKSTGKNGRADVWYKDKFIWEYKGIHKDLDKAYEQLLLYRETLGNPPLLITCDLKTIHIHTNFTYCAKETHTITLEELGDPDKLELLKKCFFNPESLKPERTQESVTKETSNQFGKIADDLRAWGDHKKGSDQDWQNARFISKLIFSMFAEDIGLIPRNSFSEIVEESSVNHEELANNLRNFFTTMNTGGFYGRHKLPKINGSLFEDNGVSEHLSVILGHIRNASRLDWANIDPSIFGTLFERIIDESKRGQLGAHYTSGNDIKLIVDPVLMSPLKEEWSYLKQKVRDLVESGESATATKELLHFSEKLANEKVLDPSCGSGNFLYISLKLLLSLQKEIIVFAVENDLGEIPLTVSPNQIYGIEIDKYAHELAQVTVWIGYIQWRYENGLAKFSEPVLQKLQNIECKDAVLDRTDIKPKESEWAEVDVIVGNPPFLGSRKMRPELGNEYCDTLESVYGGYIKDSPDFVCYWFLKATEQLRNKKVNRVGLLATQAIRYGSNREVLDRMIDMGGRIFMAWSDKEWMLEGAAVNVSIICFDRSEINEIMLNGVKVTHINPDLTSGSDITSVTTLKENKSIAFQGVVLRGKFDITQELAKKFITAGTLNQRVIKKRMNGKDITSRSSDGYVIDFGDMTEEEAKKYNDPYEYIKKWVYPERQKTNQALSRDEWWKHWNRRGGMYQKLSGLERYLATSVVSKIRMFKWLSKEIVPDHALVVFARDDDYFFGVLSSSIHVIWANAKGSQHVGRSRYSKDETFETFPLPWKPGDEPIDNPIYIEIADTARHLNSRREQWLDPAGVGIEVSQSQVNKRTLTTLYNALADYKNERGSGDLSAWRRKYKDILTIEEIEELAYLHHKLDEAVLSAYGFDSLEPDKVLSSLSVLNEERSSKG